MFINFIEDYRIYSDLFIHLPNIKYSYTGIRFNRCFISNSSYSEFIDCNFTSCIFTDILRLVKNCKFSQCSFVDEQNLNDINDKYAPSLCEGDIIVYKKIFRDDGNDYLIVKMLVPAKAKRINGYSNKCRAEYVKVLELYNTDGTISKIRNGMSGYENSVVYTKGRIVRPDKFDESREVCSNGIHFFRTFKEAVDYNG